MRGWWGPLFLDQHTGLAFYSASSPKQQSAGRQVAPLGHIILIPSQPLFALSPKCACGEATNANFIVFGLTGRGLEPTVYHTRGEHANHYSTDAVSTELNHPVCFNWKVLEFCWWRGILDTTLCDKVCQWVSRLVVFSWYSGYLHQ